MEQKLQTLSQRVDELISTLRRLRSENAELKGREKNHDEERERLMKKNAEAKSRLESIIAKLRQQDDS
ncbi:MAG: hypothetical protein DHS20C01_25360 [marine bacterium B5-7]|nr:MAG: hypothetical protein DHS20C01_25360 [marine bacterium B5-7]